MEGHAVWFDKDGNELTGKDAEARLSKLRERYSKLREEARSTLLGLAQNALREETYESDVDAVFSLGEALSEIQDELYDLADKIAGELKNY